MVTPNTFDTNVMKRRHEFGPDCNRADIEPVNAPEMDPYKTMMNCSSHAHMYW